MLEKQEETQVLNAVLVPGLCANVSSPRQPPPPATPWWRNTSAGASARTTRSPSLWQTPCPSQGRLTTTSPKRSGTRGSRSKLPRTACPAVLSRPLGGARRPPPPTWSITLTRPLSSHEDWDVCEFAWFD